MPSRHHNCECKKMSHTKYVQGGAADNGNGSKFSPYNSLATAQADPYWKTLIVLPSTISLEGNLILQDGQNLRGKVDPTKLGNNVVGTLTTLSGNTVTCLGNNKISYLRFENIDHIAIKLTQAENVVISKVHITKFNLGNYFEFSFWESGAIQGFQNTKSGTITVKDSVIEYGTCGIQLSVAGSAVRKLNACNNIVRNLTAELICIGIGGAATENGIIHDNYSHNYLENLQTQTYGAGLWGTSSHLILIPGDNDYRPGGTLFADWKYNTLQNMGNTISNFGFWSLFLVNEGTSNTVTWDIFNNYMNRGDQATLFQLNISDFEPGTPETGATVNINFKKNRIDKHAYGYVHYAGTIENVIIEDNTFNDLNVAIDFLALNDNGSIVFAKIINNEANQLSEEFLGLYNDEGFWKKLSIEMDKNCITDAAIGVADYTDNLLNKNIKVVGRNNGFSNVPVSVSRNPGDAVMDLRSNYWGGGPANVVVNGVGQGSVDVSNYLTVNPCPHPIYQFQVKGLEQVENKDKLEPKTSYGWAALKIKYSN